ncbi:MAG TPA: hypothetical protein VGS12_16485 [Caulobacteraceae bacterium]|nr:hypothetical protein [Caulobacteraceae bacterium]
MMSFRTALLGLVATGAVLSIAAPASAEIVCNRWNECWHVTHHYTYPSDVGIVVHGDDWRAAHLRHYHWMQDRDDDRGYWDRTGVWIALPPDGD